MTRQEYFDANRLSWDERVPIHVASEFYAVDAFREGWSSLHPSEPDEVGDVAGKTLLHLQCHFGQDTLSWARLGARVTGLDFSGEAVAAARELAAAIGVEAEFVEANVYDAVEALGGRTFDVVYTGTGALNWLPDVPRWAEVAAACVAPGGILYLREFHPFGQIFDDETEDGLCIRYRYFHDPEPDHWDDPGTYADRSAPTVHNETYEWVHPLSEVVTSIAQTGLAVELLNEFDESGFRQFPFMVQGEHDRTWVLPEHRESVPLMYSIRARKPG